MPFEESLMTHHQVEPERATLHGHWSRDLPPVLTIDPGDTVQFRTLDAAWGIEKPATPKRPDVQFEPRDPQLDAGHALCGPVAVRGAEPGMVLAVTVEELRTGTWGWNGSGGQWLAETGDPLGAVARDFFYLWTLDPDNGMGRNQSGHAVRLSPFMGVMGMPADEPGVHSTRPPRTNGGNIDCKELVVGSTLYLPIAVTGGLFSTGDGHAVQGDGEVSGTAIECAMDRCVLRFDLRDDWTLTTPRAHTAEGWLTFGFHEDLNQAAYIALSAMLDLIMELHHVDRAQALALASVAVDLRVTQIVNAAQGVHAVLPHGALLTAS
jgi:acetamidase/formamidase